MSEKRMYWFLFRAESAQAAAERAHACLVNWRAREFYDEFRVIESGVKLSCEVTDRDNEYLRYRAAVEEQAQAACRKLFAGGCPDSSIQARYNRIGYGWELMKLGAMLAEEMCSDMPWFNTIDWDYSWQNDEDIWAVPVELWI